MCEKKMCCDAYGITIFNEDGDKLDLWMNRNQSAETVGGEREVRKT